MTVRCRIGHASGLSCSLFCGPELTFTITGHEADLRDGDISGHTGDRFALRVNAHSHGVKGSRVFIYEIGPACEDGSWAFGPFLLQGPFHLHEAVHTTPQAVKRWRSIRRSGRVD